MALMVGEILARINADKSGFTRTAGQVKAEHSDLVKKVGNDKAKIDGDSKPFEQAADRTVKAASGAGKAIDAAFEAAAKSASADLDRIAKDAQALGDAGREAGAGLGEGLADGLSQALGVVGGGGPLGDLLDSMAGGAKGAALGAGLAVGGALIAGLQQRWAELKVGALIAAQTGAAASEAARLGSLAGRMYADGFGDSIEDAGRAIASVVNVLIPVDATDEAIGRIASKVSTLGTVMEEEFGRVSRSAKTLLLNGMAGNVAQALDMIARANEQGLNIAGDLLDTIDEYSGQFARLGLEGPEAFGLLSQAMQGGARDTDFAADALKEFVIRAQDGSVATARGFQALGFNAQEMAGKIAAGGDTARQALRDTLNALQALPPGIERNSAAVDLFGTKAEDLGQALFDMDLDDAADQFGDFAGSVEEAAQKLAGGQSGVEKFDRAMTSVKSSLGEFIDALASSDELDGLKEKINELTLAADRWMSTGDTSWLDELKEKYPELADGIDAYIEKNRAAVEAQMEAKGASDAATGSYQEQVRTLQDLIGLEQERAGGVLSLSEAEIAYQESLAAANQSLVDNKKNIDLSTEAGRNNQGALNDLADRTWNFIESMEAQGATTKDVQGFMEGARAQFVQMAIAMGYGETQAQQLADKLGLIPGNYEATVKVLGAEHGANMVQNLLNKIAAMPAEKVITLRVNTTGSGLGGFQYAGQATGSVAEFYASGGVRPMAGNSAGIVQSYSRTGVMRVIGDNPRFAEGYIPLDPSSARSQAILDEVLKRMRPEWFNASAGGAAGGYGGGGASMSTAAGPTYVDRSITLHAVPSVPTIQQLRDLQHEEEVLYG